MKEIPRTRQLHQLPTVAEEIRDCLATIVRQSKEELAEAFYVFMLEDEEAAPFLNVKTVEARLKPGLAIWLERLFCHTNEQELDAVLAMQRHVGEVHARADIPVHLVARGMRLLKRALNDRVFRSRLDDKQQTSAVVQVSDLIDVAFEEMSSAFLLSHERSVRADEGFRRFAAGANLAVEREKQLGALLDWEIRLLRAATIEVPPLQVPRLVDSSFGLWIRHKAPLVFEEAGELSQIRSCVESIDNALVPEVVFGDGGGSRRNALVQSLGNEIEQLKFLLVAMFDRLTDLEVGRDSLTQLFNRRFLPTILRREIDVSRRHSGCFSLAMVDVDFFKRVNDTCGHDGGDRVLQLVASVMLSQVRAGDFVFRYGGEEFLIVLAEIGQTQAMSVLEKIRRRIEETPIPLPNDQTLHVTASIGLAEHRGHPDYQHLIDRADRALYAAKAAGRNRVVVAAD